MEERAESEVEACMRRGEGAHPAVVGRRSAGSAVQALEQADVMPVERRALAERTRDRQLRIDAEDVGDRRLLEVEHRWVFAEVRDLEDGAVAAVVDQEGRVPLAAEVDRSAFHPEDLVGDARDLVGIEAGRLCLENGQCPGGSDGQRRLRWDSSS